MGERIFLGVVTCQRDDYLRAALDGIRDHVRDLVDWVAIAHDGLWPGARGFDPPWPCFHTTERRGPAATKDELLLLGLDLGADWIFLSEDDVVVRSPLAVTGYLDAARASGLGHLCFHAHGPANAGSPVDVDGPVAYWRNYVGAWCLYSRRSLEVGGLIDPKFTVAWDHVEHTLRLATHGFCPLPEARGLHRVPDASGSENWIAEIPGSIERSAIRQLWPDLIERQRASRAHWRETYPSTYGLVFAS